MKIIPYNKTIFDNGNYEIGTEIRYKIIDNNKIIDDAQGYGYKSKVSANKAIAYKFKGGKQKNTQKLKIERNFLKIMKG